MKRFIISGGGTGGHIFPAIAIADELKRRLPDAEILFVGAKDRMEMQKVPQAGYPIEGLWISGLQRKLSWQNLLFPLKFISSLLKSRSIIKRFKPDAVIGTGGFASGAVVKVAGQMGIPTFIQEQNSYAGITNKMLAKNAHKICVAYDAMEQFFPKEKIVKTGNPIRDGLLNIGEYRSEGLSYFHLDSERKTLLVLGGSLGARRINQLIEQQLPLFEQLGVQVLWQCGKLYYEEYKKYNSEQVRVLAFIDRMELAYAAADVIISRAGASSVSELCIVGKPVIFIPSPNVAEDHQTKNARAIADKQAAILLRESELNEQFANTFSKLIANEAQQEALSAHIKALAQPNATKDIVNLILND
ncbi:UDP-N-acetylglucosamine-N-acetylmuramylpentapeptide N-acetylglucosamine transferase [Capnocytophaga leadbetteri]|uniref:UDP-N-acetylglucosamine--N-acetylmuramyl-(pentapeptide) pyrophosphoryl-undecaprenol N-acetylglucosamine transferase n=1 Tax=Capnocytophaga leadbetteri TaxID=327575 RepID=A0A2T5XT65_9FLAO|nr:undecaprenyldiphospho-muramoylpentapeptide beta-N-acetylglucosaminyltransferase [Capnocytophaga leadbetteri]PTX05776.1 UDP-N-acetylglucosamine-N-acetylmuramylpentapeptide N-acetylglucosamine transferase [Capnocytophaga leadbetteri]